MANKRLEKSPDTMVEILSAYHEAGHIVIGLLCGQIPTASRITHRGQISAWTKFIQPSLVGMNDQDIILFRNLQLMTLLAGGIAESKMFEVMTGQSLPKRFTMGSLIDNQEFDLVLKELKTNQNGKSQKSIYQILVRHNLTECWDLVISIAYLLLEKKSITFPDICCVIVRESQGTRNPGWRKRIAKLKRIYKKVK